MSLALLVRLPVRDLSSVELPPSVEEATDGPRLAALDLHAIPDTPDDASWTPIGLLLLPTLPRRSVNMAYAYFSSSCVMYLIAIPSAT